MALGNVAVEEDIIDDMILRFMAYSTLRKYPLAEQLDAAREHVGKLQEVMELPRFSAREVMEIWHELAQ